MIYANLGGLGGDRWLRSHPDDVSDLHIVGEDGLLSAVKVQDGRIAWLVESEKYSQDES